MNEKDSTDVKSIVCVDADYTGYDDPNGERVFNDDGTNTQFLENILNFLQTYQRGLELTKLFGQHINNLNILTTKDIGISLKSGQKYTIRDVLIIDEKSLLNLPDLEIAELVRKKYMEWIYFHLNSLNNFDTIINAQAKEVEN